MTGTAIKTLIGVGVFWVVIGIVAVNLNADMVATEVPPPVAGVNNALLFDGIDDYVEIPEIAALRCLRPRLLNVSK